MRLLFRAHTACLPNRRWLPGFIFGDLSGAIRPGGPVPIKPVQQLLVPDLQVSSRDTKPVYSQTAIGVARPPRHRAQAETCLDGRIDIQHHKFLPTYLSRGDAANGRPGDNVRGEPDIAKPFGRKRDDRFAAAHAAQPVNQRDGAASKEKRAAVEQKFIEAARGAPFMRCNPEAAQSRETMAPASAQSAIFLVSCAIWSVSLCRSIALIFPAEIIVAMPDGGDPQRVRAEAGKIVSAPTASNARRIL